MPGSDEAKGAVLVLAPQGRDAALAAKTLEQAGIRAETCKDLSEMAQCLDESTNALLIAEEALIPSEVLLLLDTLGRQPPWSDVPVIILAAAGSGEEASARNLEIFGPAVNVTLLERPLRTVTLVAAAKTAMRARQRQREVRDLIASHDTVLASISDAFSALDRNWRYTYVNSKVAELAGIPKEKMIGRVIWEIFPEAVGGEFYERSHQAMEKRQPEHFEVFYKPWERWLDTRIYPTKEGIVIFRADVTERRRQEELTRENERKLKELEERSRLAVEAADVGTFDFYPPTGELKWSNRCNEIFGLPRNSKVDYATYVSGVHPEDRAVIQETVQGVLKPGSSGRYDIEYRVIGIEDRRERWVSEKGRAILDPSGHATRFIGTILDITASKTAAIRLERAKKAAEEANKAKDQFLAMLSHELRTPLTPVLMTIASLQRDPNISDELLRDLEMLQRNVELEALLIDDLLDLTRISHGKLELHNDAVNIHTTIEHALSISAAEITEKHLTLIRDFHATEHHCWADGARLQQVFWNLIKNAVKFTDPGGKVEIRTRNDQAHRIVIDVVDNGIGIDLELQPKIFDAFEQGGAATTSKYGGLGLGLAISKRVVDLHGGTIAVKSAGRGEGSMFTVILQAMETSLLEGPARFLETPAFAGGKREILLVEDHEDTARVLRRMLESAGYGVCQANSIAGARDLATKRAFNLLISDVGLPDGSGLDLMRELREKQRMTGIALSGFGMDEDRAASKEAGFVEHFTKPVDWVRLHEAVERLTSAARAETESAA
jgi:PAS domain S-box-containing protein